MAPKNKTQAATATLPNIDDPSFTFDPKRNSSELSLEQLEKLFKLSPADLDRGFNPQNLHPNFDIARDPGFSIPSNGPDLDPGFTIRSKGPDTDPGFNPFHLDPKSVPKIAELTPEEIEKILNPKTAPKVAELTPEDIEKILHPDQKPAPKIAELTPEEIKKLIKDGNIGRDSGFPDTVSIGDPGFYIASKGSDLDPGMTIATKGKDLDPGFTLNPKSIQHAENDALANLLKNGFKDDKIPTLPVEEARGFNQKPLDTLSLKDKGPKIDFA